MAGKLVHLAALFVATYPSATVLYIVILDLHLHGGADAREGISHERDERTIAKPDQRIDLDRIEERPHLFCREYRGFAFLHAVAWPADGVGWIQGDHLSGYQPIEEHPYRREVLLHRRLRMPFHERLDVGCHVNGLHIAQREFPRFAPIGKPRGGYEVRFPRIPVADIRRKELPEALARIRRLQEYPRNVPGAGIHGRKLPAGDGNEVTHEGASGGTRTLPDRQNRRGQCPLGRPRAPASPMHVYFRRLLWLILCP